MLAKILGQVQMTQMLKKLRGGPQSMAPMSPAKGSGVANASGLTPKKPRGYVTPMQKPNWTVPKPMTAKKKV
jgi:hypothetical protein